MKKALKITGVVLLVFIAALLILPFAFQGKIKDLVKTEANKMLTAELDFEDLSLSFIRNFPKATISIDRLSLVGTGSFQNDTLLAVDKIRVTVNLKSIFGSSGYEISSILLEQPAINAIVLKDGTANWDIMKSDGEPVEDTVEDTVPEAQSDNSFKLILQKLAINAAAITYRDEQANMQAALQGLNLSLSGDMGATHTMLQTAIDIAGVNFMMDNISYLSKANVALKMDVDADLNAMKFTFNENTFRLNAIEAGFDGWLAMLDEGFDMDIKLNTSKIEFKQILSLIPAIYAKDFEGIAAGGEVALNAAAKGKMIGDTLPSFDVHLGIGNAHFRYPQLPKAVEKIAVDLQLTNPGGSADLTIIDLRKFHFEMAGNPFNIGLKITTPLSDAAVNGAANGYIDLGMVKEIYPLDEGMSLNGQLTADLSFAFRLSQIEKEQFDNITANGDLQLKNMLYKSTDFPDIHINTTHLKFSPRYVDLKAFDMKMGANDLAAAGRLDNVIAFVMKGQTLKGALNVSSRYFNLDDLMSSSSSPEEADATADTSALTAFEVPKNIDFALDAKFAEVLFDNITLKNTTGKILVKDGKVDLKNLSTHALSGTIILNGSYSTVENPQHPEVNMGIDIRNASFAETFHSFDMIKKLAPIFEKVGGNYSVKFDLKTGLDNHFSPDLSSLLANGSLQSKELNIQNVTALTALSKALNNDKLAHLQAKDLNLAFHVTDGRVHTKPFDMATSIGKLNLSGSTGLDETIDYTVKVDLPESTLDGKFGKLAANVKIKGTFKNPTIEIGAKEMASQIIDQVKSEVTKKIDAAKEETNKKLLEEAQKQGERLKAEAKAAGEKLVEEAAKQGKKLIEEANKTSNAIAKIAAVKVAEQAAQKLNEEAEKQARRLNEEAEKQAQNLINAAVIK